MPQDEIYRIDEIKAALFFLSSSIIAEEGNFGKEVSTILELLTKELGEALKNLQKQLEV